MSGGKGEKFKEAKCVLYTQQNSSASRYQMKTQLKDDRNC